MVKIQKHKAYTYKAEDGREIEHYKYLVTVPVSAITELGWQEGQELNIIVNQHALVLKAGNASNKPKAKKE